MNSNRQSSMQWMALPAAILAFTQVAGAQDIDPFGGRDLPPTTPRSILEQRDCHSTDLQEAATSWTKIASLPQFDPALGILRGYRLTLTAKVAGDAGVENLSGEPANVTLTFGSRLTVSRPGGGVLIDLAPSKAFPDQLSAFDGLLNYAGTSGVTHTHLDLDSIEGSAVSSSSDLRTFSGSPGHPGSLDFIVSVENTSGATGAGHLPTLFHQTASADLTICYIYDADCNANGLPDATDVAGGTSLDANDDFVPDECQPSVELFCFGDGPENGGPDCNCGNSAPGNTGGCLNETSVGVHLTATGVPSVQNDTFVLAATHLPGGVPTFYLQGTAMANHGVGVPFEEGLLCITGQIIRVDKVQSAPEGGGPVLFPAFGDPPISMQLGIIPGQTLTYQTWYRSPNGPCHLNANTSNGVRVVWGM